MLQDLQISISGYEKRNIRSKKVVFYDIQMKASEKNWIVSKRYSELVALNNYIKTNFLPVPSFPKKMWICNTKTTYLEVRKTSLDLYFHVI
jgi:hypothetical protein